LTATWSCCPSYGWSETCRATTGIGNEACKQSGPSSPQRVNGGASGR